MMMMVMELMMARGARQPWNPAATGGHSGLWASARVPRNFI